MSVLPRLLFLACVLVAPGLAVTADDGLDERLAACSACHGEHGEGMAGAEYNPHLAGKPAGYLLDQMQAFRDGRRQNVQMAWLMRYLDDRYLGEIAAHYAAMPPHTAAVNAQANAPALSPELAQRARVLVQDGDPAHGVPACAACHGRDLAGLEPGVPALVGLPAEYVVAQFGAWRTGVRKARAPDCMADVARALDPADVRAVAAWLARQPHTAGQRPAVAGSLVPPVACGSLPHSGSTP